MENEINIFAFFYFPVNGSDSRNDIRKSQEFIEYFFVPRLRNGFRPRPDIIIHSNEDKPLAEQFEFFFRSKARILVGNREYLEYLKRQETNDWSVAPHPSTGNFLILHLERVVPFVVCPNTSMDEEEYALFLKGVDAMHREYCVGHVSAP